MPAVTEEKAFGLTPPTRRTEKTIDREGIVLGKRVEPFTKDYPDGTL